MRLLRADFVLPLTATAAIGLLLAGDAFAQRVTAGQARVDAAKAVQPHECWSVKGPFNDGKETYFNATSNCDLPHHCRVWVNHHEPPYQIHLEKGGKGRIDVGATESTDQYSSDCLPVSAGM